MHCGVVCDWHVFLYRVGAGGLEIHSPFFVPRGGQIVSQMAATLVTFGFGTLEINDITLHRPWEV